MNYEIRRLTWEEAESGWRGLESDGYIGLPYLCYDWASIWWRHYGRPPRELFLLGAFADRRMVGLLPLFLEEMRLKNLFAVCRVLKIIGAREFSYNDLILVDRDRETVAAALARHLCRNYPRLVIDFHDLRPDSHVVSLLARQTRGWRKIIKDHHCPYISLNKGWDGYVSSLGRRTRKNIRQITARLAGQEGLAIELSTDTRYAEDLFNLHRRRWGMDPEDPKLARLEAYEKEVIEMLSRKGWLRMFVNKIGGRCAAVLWAYDHHGVRYFHKIGFDEGLSCFSPGTALMVQAVKEAMERGLREYDFLRGAEAYKLALTKEMRTCYRLVAAGRWPPYLLYRILS